MSIHCRREHAKTSDRIVLSILHDYTPFVVPNSIANVLEGHSSGVKAARFVGADGKRLVSGAR